MTTIYQVCDNINQQSKIYDFSKPVIKNDSELSAHHITQHIYEHRQMKSEYIGILSWNYSQQNHVNLNLNKICGKYDMYLPPLEINKKHDVFKHAAAQHPYIQDILIYLLDALNLPLSLKPKLGIYYNSVIAKKEVYRDYVKNYLRPALEFLSSKHININITCSILDLLWSIYYEHNKKNLKTKTFRRNTLVDNISLTVVDLSDTASENVDKIQSANYPINLLYSDNKKIKFQSNKLTDNIIKNSYYNALLNGYGDSSRIVINKQFFSDLQTFGCLTSDHDISIYSNSIRSIEHISKNIVEIQQCLNTKVNALYLSNTSDIQILYGKTNLMNIFYNLTTNINTDFSNFNFYKYVETSMAKLGVRIYSFKM